MLTSVNKGVYEEYHVGRFGRRCYGVSDFMLYADLQLHGMDMGEHLRICYGEEDRKQGVCDRSLMYDIRGGRCIYDADPPAFLQ